MSAEILLIPLALAALTALQVARREERERVESEPQYVWSVTTAMKDAALIRAALRDLGLTASWEGEVAGLIVGGWRVALVPQEGRYGVLLEEGITREEALTFATTLEQAYTRCVQAAVLTRIQVQAAQSGLRVVGQQRNPDRSVTLTLRVEQS